MQILVKLILFQVSTEDFFDQRVVECPRNVDGTNIRSFLEHQFGEALDISWTRTAEGEEVSVGWTFSIPEYFSLQGDPADFELIAIPTIEDPDSGELVSLFMRLAEQRKFFEDQEAQGEMRLTKIQAPEQGWTPEPDT